MEEFGFCDLGWSKKTLTYNIIRAGESLGVGGSWSQSVMKKCKKWPFKNNENSYKLNLFSQSLGRRFKWINKAYNIISILNYNRGLTPEVFNFNIFLFVVNWILA